MYNFANVNIKRSEEMITKLRVDGFRSLNAFSIEFHEGLNVLIGPNGAGKSNICNVIGLISAFVDNNFDEYIHSLGGIKSVFKICDTKSSEPQNNKIDITCEGLIKDVHFKKDKVTLKYLYSFTIMLIDQEINIQQEELKLYKLNLNNRYENILKSYLTKERLISVNIKDKKAIGPTTDIFEKEDIGKSFTVNPYYKHEENGMKSILQSLQSIFYCYIIRGDLSGSKVWNIDPYLAKKPSDLTEPYVMLSSGRRLSQRLYHLDKEKSDTIEIIEDLLPKIIPRFTKIVTHISTEELVRTFSLVDNNGVEYPAKCLSDGTIKILALLVGVFNRGYSISIIEEPENYLHPWATQTLIEYLREYFSEGTCIITTHSETILNLIEPEEIFVITNLNGSTICNKVTDTNQISKSISDSGFGCGYHFIAGSLGGTP